MEGYTPETMMMSLSHELIAGTQQLIAQFGSTSKLDQYAGDLSYVQIIIALSVAACLGALIAYHPKRNSDMENALDKQELRNTQILICVAGAIMVALIQGSLERAFGLVGLGSFVRYRTALRNPFDLSVIFILIGLGMACGLQYYEFAITITGFIYVLLFLMEMQAPDNLDIWTYKIDTTDPDRVERAFRQVAEDYEFDITLIKTNKEQGRFHCKFSSNEAFDRDEINKQIKEICGDDIVFIRFDWEQQIKKK